MISIGIGNYIPNQNLRSIGSPSKNYQFAIGQLKKGEILVVQTQSATGLDYTVIENAEEYETATSLPEAFLFAVVKQ